MLSHFQAFAFLCSSSLTILLLYTAVHYLKRESFMLLYIHISFLFNIWSFFFMTVKKMNPFFCGGIAMRWWWKGTHTNASLCCEKVKWLENTYEVKQSSKRLNYKFLVNIDRKRRMRKKFLTNEWRRRRSCWVGRRLCVELNLIKNGRWGTNLDVMTSHLNCELKFFL